MLNPAKQWVLSDHPQSAHLPRVASSSPGGGCFVLSVLGSPLHTAWAFSKTHCLAEATSTHCSLPCSWECGLQEGTMEEVASLVWAVELFGEEFPQSAQGSGLKVQWGDPDRA